MANIKSSMSTCSQQSIRWDGFIMATFQPFFLFIYMNLYFIYFHLYYILSFFLGVLSLCLPQVNVQSVNYIFYVFGKIPPDLSMHGQPAFCLCILLKSVRAHTMLLLRSFSTPIHTVLYTASLWQGQTKLGTAGRLWNGTDIHLLYEVTGNIIRNGQNGLGKLRLAELNGNILLRNSLVKNHVKFSLKAQSLPDISDSLKEACGKLKVQ